MTLFKQNLKVTGFHLRFLNRKIKIKEGGKGGRQRVSEKERKEKVTIKAAEEVNLFLILR